MLHDAFLQELEQGVQVRRAGEAGQGAVQIAVLGDRDRGDAGVVQVVVEDVEASEARNNVLARRHQARDATTLSVARARGCSSQRVD